MSLKNKISLAIWIILLLFNVKIGGIYSINIVAIFLTIFLIINNKKYVVLNILVFFSLLFLILIGWLNSYFYSEPFKYIFNFFQIFVFYNFFRLNEDKINFKNSIVITTLFYLALSLYEVKTGSLFWYESRNYDEFLPRVNLGFGDANSLAGFLIIFSSLIIDSKTFKVLFVFIVGVLTFSRAFLISFIFIFLYKFKNNLVVLISTLSFGVLIFYSINVVENYSFAIDRIMDSNFDDSNPRFTEWKFAVDSIGFLPNWEIFRESLDPHNSFLMALNLFGPIGAIVMFVFLFGYFWKDRFYFHRDSILLLIVSFGVFCFFNSELFSVRNTASLGMILGLLNNKRF